MIRTTCRFLTILLAYALLFFPFHNMENTLSYAEKRMEAKAVFYVRWFDVGKMALEGLKGVNRVENGFLNRKEINRVYFDPNLINVKDMKNALDEAGTFIGIAE